MTTTPDPAAAAEAAERLEELREKRKEERHETDRLMRAVFYGTVILIAWLMWKVVQPFALEIGWAVVLSICLNPIRNRLTPRMGATKAALAITLGVLFLVVIPTIFVGYTLFYEGATSVDYVQQKLADQGGPAMLFHKIWDWARLKVPVLPGEQVILSSISSSVGRILEFVAHRAGSIIAGFVGFVFSLVIMLSILFFLVRDSPGFARALRRVMPFEPELNERFMTIASDLVSASVTSSLVIAAVQGIVVGIVLLSMGVPGAVLWALMTFLLSFLPLVGAALIWAPVAIWLALSGHLVKGVVLALIGLLVLGNVDNVVRPLLLSGKGKINTLVLIISLMGGVSAFGFIGIVLGPLVAVLLTAIIESYASRSDDDLFAGVAPRPLPAASVAPAAALPGASVAPAPALPGAAAKETK
jgi:predicted PurR-regulated permease PerM